MFALVSGPLFRDPDVREAKTGRPYVRAVVKDGAGEDVVFVNVISFGGTAAFEALSHAAEGDAIAVQGRVKFKVYEKGGEHRVSVDMVADNALPAKTVKRKEPRPRDIVLPPPPPMTGPGRADFNDEIPW